MDEHNIESACCLGGDIRHRNKVNEGKLKIVLFGLDTFGIKALEVLEGMDVFIQAVFVGRSALKLHHLAHKKRYPVFVWEHRTAEGNNSILKSYAPDIIVVSSFNFILKQPTIDIPTIGVVNIHPSLLPKYRGPCPIEAAINNGDKETGVTAHLIEDKRIDSGRIIYQFPITIKADETKETLAKSLLTYWDHVLSETLCRVMNDDKETFTVQDESAATYAPHVKELTDD